MNKSSSVTPYPASSARIDSFPMAILAFPVFKFRLAPGCFSRRFICATELEADGEVSSPSDTPLVAISVFVEFVICFAAGKTKHTKTYKNDKNDKSHEHNVKKPVKLMDVYGIQKLSFDNLHPAPSIPITFYALRFKIGGPWNGSIICHLHMCTPTPPYALCLGLGSIGSIFGCLRSRAADGRH